MAGGIGHKKSNLKTFDGGEYVVQFGEWFPTDDHGMPVLSTQSRFGKDTLVARFRTVVAGEEDGPPGSIDPVKELPLFVKAFGGDPASVPALGPADYEEIPRLLVTLTPQLQSNTSVIVNDSGWISRIEGMNVPPGSKLIRFAGFTTVNDAGEISWIEGTYGPLCFGELEVLAGEFKGSRVKFLLAYPLDVDEETHNPCLVQISGGKRDGELTKPSQRWKIFHETFIGSLEEFPVESVKDIYNICPEVQAMALAANRPASIVIMDTGMANIETLSDIPEGVELSPEVLSPIGEGKKDTASPEPGISTTTPPKPVEDPLELAQVLLRSAITNECGSEAWLEDNVNSWGMTAESKVWAKEHLVPVIREFGYGKKFSEYTVEQITNILVSLGYDELAKGSADTNVNDDF